uniref:Uncharacterized protein n=1 Tax=Staphylococcus aureus TaxID=1280 RepID=D2J9I8_STAAU|nr:hypothetical protein SAP057A_013 [Staphylococcus aureus]
MANPMKYTIDKTIIYSNITDIKYIKPFIVKTPFLSIK